MTVLTYEDYTWSCILKLWTRAEELRMRRATQTGHISPRYTSAGGGDPEKRVTDKFRALPELVL